MSRCAVLSLVLLILPASSARAYLDPGAGSVMLQLLLGGVAGLFVIVKFYWRRILAFLGIRDRANSRK